MTDPQRLMAVVLAYGPDRIFEPLLDSLLAEGLEPQAVLVVHNQATADEPPPAVPEGFRVVQTPNNLGYAGGMNFGLAEESVRCAETVLLLTHDARLRPGALAALTAALDARPTLGIVAPALVFSGSDVPFSFGGITRGNGTNAHVVEPPAREPDGVATCDWVDGGTMLVRRAVFDGGGFDDRFWGYCEEAEFCLRARRAGFGVGVALDALADQAPGGAKRPGAWAYLLTRNSSEYARRAVGVRGSLFLTGRGLVLVAGYLVRSAARALHLRPGDPRETSVLASATARGIWDFARRRMGPPPANLPGMGDVGNA